MSAADFLSPGGALLLVLGIVFSFAAIQAKRVLVKLDDVGRLDVTRINATYDAVIRMETTLTGELGVVKRLDVVAGRAHRAEAQSAHALNETARIDTKVDLLTRDVRDLQRHPRKE